MKVAFVGKGGSGKTTIASLLVRYLAHRQLPVLAIDADINQHLAGVLDISESIPPLGIEIDRIKEYIRGDNIRIKSMRSVVKTTPPGNGSRLLFFNQRNSIFDYFEKVKDKVRVMAVGEFSEEDLGVKCYHSKVGAVELVLNHLVDGEKEYVVVDMTAGADSFASGLFTKFDVTFLVVEPTLKSVSVYQQYKEYAKSHGVVVKVVGNKIENEEDVGFLGEHVGDDLLTVVHGSGYVRSMEKGKFFPIGGLEEKNMSALAHMHATVDACKKDWKKFYADAVYFHKKNAQSWANTAIGEDLEDQIDPDFQFEKYIADKGRSI